MIGKEWLKNTGQFPGGLILVLAKTANVVKPYELSWYDHKQNRTMYVLDGLESLSEAKQTYRLTLKDIADEAIQGIDTLALEAEEAVTQ